MLVACRNKDTPEYLKQAIEYYKELQQIVERLHGYDNDQTALVYKMMAETYASLGEFGKLCQDVGRLSNCISMYHCVELKRGT